MKFRVYIGQKIYRSLDYDYYICIDDKREGVVLIWNCFLVNYLGFFSFFQVLIL